MIRNFTKHLCVLTAFLLPMMASAQGFQVNFQGQRQQGMGLAGTALFQDASTLFYNPGTVAFSNENSVNVGITPIFANVLYVDSSTMNGYRTQNPVGTPFQAYALFQLKDSAALKFGLAVYTPFGSTVQWEEGWIGRFAITRLSLRAIFIQPTVSYKLSEKLGIGGGFVISTGGVTLQRDLPIQFANGDYANATLSGSAIGFGFNLGLHFKATDKFSIGLNYRSGIRMKVSDGEAKFNVPESLNTNFPDGTFASSLPLPRVITLGLAHKFNEKLTAVLDVNYVGWSTYDTLAFDYTNNTASLQDTKSPRDYKNIFAFRGGASYQLTESFCLRAGGGYGLSPVQNGYVTPETPDGNRFYGTFGLGYNFDQKLSIDASLFYTQVQRADTNLETNLSGTFFTKAIAPGFSIIYRW
jgi:long-chain fatty acid transport protein